MSKKKVVLLKSLLCRKGGAEKYALRLAHAFNESGADVTLLTSGSKPLEPVPFEIVSLEKKSWMSVQAVERFDQFCTDFIKSHPADVVFGLDRNRNQTHLRASNGVHAAYLKRRGMKEGLWKKLFCQINPLHQTLLSIEKNSFESPDLKKIFTNSFMVKEEILHTYSVPSDKIEVVHNGVEWQSLAKPFARWQEERSQHVQHLNLPSSVYHFLFVGHNYRRKGLEELLKALYLLPTKDFHLSVVGREKKIHYFQALVEKLDLKKQVSFFGAQNHLSSFYQLADALVIPSFYDPFANVTVEALAMGLHVVSSLANGGHEVLSEEEGTLIADPLNQQAFSLALLHAMQFPKTPLRASMTREAVKHLDFSHQLGKLINKVLL